MKVVHINTYDQGGAAIAAIRLHKGLLAEGVDSHFYTLHKTRNDIPNHHKHNSTLNTLPDTSLTFSNYLKAKLSTSYKVYFKENEYRKKLYREAKKHNLEMISFPNTPYLVHKDEILQEADIVHLHWVSDFIDYPSFFRKIKQPIFWTFHDENPYKGIFHYSADEKTAHAVSECLKEIDKKAQEIKKEAIRQNCINMTIVSPSKWLGEAAVESSFYERAHINQIPYGIDTSTFRQIPQKEARSVLGLPQTKKIFLFVGQSVDNYRKGFDLLLDAIEGLDLTDIMLCAAGSASADSKNNKINYLGSFNDERLLALAYNAADLFILPSREDNLPNTMLESLCCGTPVICFPTGGMEEEIESGENGIVAKSVNGISLKECILVFLANQNIYNREAIAAQSSHKFVLKKQAEKYHKLYDKSVESGKLLV